MIYKFGVTENGIPKTGLTPTWQSLKTVAGVDKSGSAPAISEIGGGWYKFSVAYKTAPFDVPELVGVIDAGNTLCAYERYKFVLISLRDLALAKLVNKATYDLVNGVESIRNDADTADELSITLSQADQIETRST